MSVPAPTDGVRLPPQTAFLIDFETFAVAGRDDPARGLMIMRSAVCPTGISVFPGRYGPSRYPALGIASACRPTRKETDEE